MSAFQRIPVAFDQPKAHLAHVLGAAENGRRPALAERHPDDRRRRADEQGDDQNAEVHPERPGPVHATPPKRDFISAKLSPARAGRNAQSFKQIDHFIESTACFLRS
ncbi:hypothetical protein D9M72_555040 [compost metagenome]